MIMKRLGISFVLAAALTCVSCIYDFDPQVEDASQFVVVEGDILIGDYSYFRVSESRNLKDLNVFISRFTGTASVECDDGTSASARGSLGEFLIDTRNMKPGKKYRFSVTIPEMDGKIYYSDWVEVHQAGVIDSVTYTIDPQTKSEMWINVTSHNDNDEKYYRWMSSENWEYCADYYATFYYVPDQASKRDYGPGKVLEYENGENTNWCWKVGTVSDVMLGDLSELSQTKFVNHKLYSIDKHDRRVSYLYSPQISQVAISEEAYRYWSSMSKNSDDVGGLFSPQPSECRGNIHCAQDSTELVLGYVGASTVSRCRIFIAQADTRFYEKKKESGTQPEPTLVQKSEWRAYYLEGWLPFQPHFDEEGGMADPVAMEQFDWLPARCLDCTLLGGTKDKPSWWPNEHR